ncbi:MAG: response-associated peptidase [Microbacteriaceae bacterium]|jgi:putative SOS response-associated peptidase YedK|nr:response-associated peptidase [Microbacteriaceae bacterium]
MCGRFAVDKETNELIEEFVAAGGSVHDWVPSWNLAPTQQVPVVLESVKTGELVRRLETARWSFVPSWSKELSLKYPTFNARSETAATKSTFSASVRSKRAIIPASGYYEWHTDPETKKKTPFYIHAPEGRTLALAGIYSWWKDHGKAEDDPTSWNLTAAILTSDAVDELLGIHDRNPVPLPREWWDDWLNPAIEGDQDFLDAAVAAALSVAGSLEVREVAPIPYKADGPQLVQPVASD